MQRQLQLRIEAQGKYLKKIIEEQQKFSGAQPEAPGSEDNCPESKIMTDPVIPTPAAFETPVMEMSGKECGPLKNISVDERERREPLTPDSGCHLGSPVENPIGERSLKKQRVNMELSHQILESSIRPPFHQQQQSVYLTNEVFGHSSGMPVDNEN